MVAVLAVGAMVLVRLYLQPVLGESAPLLPFTCSVLVSAWYGGFGPGLCATAVGAIAGAYFLVPVNDFRIVDIGDRAHIAIFVLIGLATSGLCEALHRARRRAEQRQIALQESEQRLRALSRRLVEIQESERRGIARELHDEIGQTLTGLKLSLDVCARGLGGSDLERVTDAQAIVGDLMSQVRQLSLDLRPTMLDDLGLLHALLWLFERYQAQTRIAVAFEHAGLGERFPPATETAAYRIVQEALTNVARHAAIDCVEISVRATGEAIVVEVQDRGAGFDPATVREAATTGGLSGIRERAELLGGRATVDSIPGRGTTILASLPLTETPIEPVG